MLPVMELALLPIIGPVVAILGLAWGVYVVVSKRPRLHVVLELHVTDSFISKGAGIPYPAKVSPRVIVLNKGGEACMVADVGICDTNKAPLVRAEREQANATGVTGKEVPARVEGHGHEQWQFPWERVHAEVEVGREFLGYATVARPQRRWPRSRRSQYRIYVSKFPEVRGGA